MTEQSITKKTLVPENTLDFYVQARNGKKRDYIYDYGESRTCDHSTMKVIARGGIVYRCMDCNYTFHITGAYQQPYHNEVIMAAFTMLGFAKEFGMNAVGEVLRRPIGQNDGSQHKPVLPEGMSFMDVLDALEEVDVNTLDQGAAELRALIEHVWEGGNLTPVLTEGDNGNNDNGTGAGR